MAARLLARLCLFALLVGSTRAQEDAGANPEGRTAPPVPAADGSAVALPPGFYLEDAAGGARFTLPTAVAAAPDGRLFVAEKQGLVWIVERGARLATPFLDLRAEVMDHWDRGLLGLALDPAFATNGRLYLLYTVDRDGTGDRDRRDVFGRLASYAASAANPNAADVASRTVLIGATFTSGIPACYASHAPGTLAFGSDGTLLVGTGDAASFNSADAGGIYDECFGAGRLDPSEDIGAFRALRVESLAGKILRVDPATGLGLPSNPFYTGNPADNASRVWAMGLRNPFRFAVAPGGSADPADGRPGTVVLGDVGWFRFEELDVALGGESFGWPCREGPDAQPEYQALTPATNGCGVAPRPTPPDAYFVRTDPALSSPIHLKGRSITGGAFYTGTRYPPEWQGAFFAGDYSFGWMTTSRLDGGSGLTGFEVFSDDAGPVVDVKYDPTTEHLLWVNIGAGTVLRLRHVGGEQNQPPVATATATPTQGEAPLDVQFSSDGTFDPEGAVLTYAWAFGDGGTSTATNPAHTYTTTGVYAATLTATDDFSVSATTTATVTVGEALPEIALLEPTAGAAFAPGEAVELRAVAYDANQPAATLRIRWNVVQVHSNHEHPDFLEAEGPTALFVVPEHGDGGELVYYRVRVSVTDASGLVATAERALRVAAQGEADATAEATPIALVTSPGGSGSRNLETVRDGVTPAPGTLDPQLQYDTDDGLPRATDWIGYAYPAPQPFTRLEFQEGMHFADGGWFEALGVEVRRDDVWRPVESLHVEPAYRGDDGRGFDMYALLFDEAEGDATRLVGPPGGSAGFISVGELWAFVRRAGALPEGWVTADVGQPARAGSAVWDGGGQFAVSGGGSVGGPADAFHYAYRRLDGDGEMTARLASVEGASPWAKAGLMLRESAEPGARHAFLFGTPGAGVHLQSRPARNGPTDSLPGPPPDGGGSAPVWLRLARAADVVTGYTSPDGVAWAAVGSLSLPIGSGALVGLAVTATDGEGQSSLATAAFEGVVVEAATGLPPVWTSTDVGPVAVPGTVAYDGGTYRVTGAGDTQGDADAFHFVHQPLAGDGAISARLDATNALDPWAKLGLMVRGGLERGASHAFLAGTPERGVHLQYRQALDGLTENVLGPDVTAPVWLRLERLGPTLTAYTSGDGQAWEPFGSVQVAMPPDALIGLAVTATDPAGRGDAALAQYTAVSVGGLLPVGQSPDGPGPAPAFGIRLLYPNPTAGTVTLRLGVEAPGDVAVEVFDVLGRRVYAHTLPGATPGLHSLALDLAGRAPGLYVLRVRHDASGKSAQRRLTLVQ